MKLANLHLVTGYAGNEHVTAADSGAFNVALLGSGQFVIDKGSKLVASVITNNKIRIADGDIYMQGRFIRLNEGTYVDLAIDNGAQGKKRNDLIVARYTKDAVSGVEEVNLVVIKGTAVASTSNPVDPAYNSSNIVEGKNNLNDMPLYRVPIDGLNVQTLVPLFTVKNWLIPSAAADLGAVPTTRKVNGKALSSDISLTAANVGAVPTTQKINNKALSSDISLTAADVGAVAKNGDTMTGNLYLSKETPLVRLDDTAKGSSAMMAISNDQLLIQNIDKTGNDANRRQIILRNASHTNASLAEALLLNTVINNAQKAYRLYGEHNKPTAADVGAVALDGSNYMTGNLSVQKASPIVILKDTSTEGETRTIHAGHGYAVQVVNKTGDYSTRRQLSIYDSADKANVADALQLFDIVGGKNTPYTVLHTGNMSANGVAKIETGSYVGTGGSGAGAKTSITTSFKPKFVYVVSANDAWYDDFSYDSNNPFGCYHLLWTDGLTKETGWGHTYGNYNRLYELNGNTLSWYIEGSSDGSHANKQLNRSGVTYHYIAIG